MFIFDVLANRRAIPVQYSFPSDDFVRRELDMKKEEEVTDEDRLRCAMQVTEQELLMYALADYIVEL